MRALLVTAVLGILVIGGWSAVTFKAPRIEADIASRANAATAPVSKHGVEVDARGRHVNLKGIADHEAERDALIAAAGEVRGVVGVVDRLEVLETASPYVIEAELEADGTYTLSGSVPDVAMRDAVMARSRDLAPGGAATGNLILATGMPEGDWTGMVETGLRAVGVLEKGSMRLVDLNGTISGTADGVEARDEVREILGENPEGAWELELELILPVISPYRFLAEKGTSSFTWEGYAPTDEVKQRLTERAEALGGSGASGRIMLATGMPDDNWPAVVESGLGSLALLTAGALEVADNKVLLSGIVKNSEELKRVTATLGSDWQTDIQVLSPDPAPRLTVVIEEDGSEELTGVLPRNFKISRLADAFPVAEVNHIPTNGAGDVTSWTAAVDAFGVITPRLLTAEATVTEGEITMVGVMKRDFAASAARAALNAALPGGWKLDADLADAPPLARLLVSKSADGVAISGVLPAGFDLDDAAEITGDATTTLEENGEGDPALWSGLFGNAVRLATVFDAVEISLAQNEANIAGTLSAGQSAKDIEDWAEGLLPEKWRTRIELTETPADEGTTRYDPRRDLTEILSAGYWLPEVTFEPTTQGCEETASATLGAEKVAFVTGSARIDDRAGELLNLLAAIALRCVNEAGLKLEIDGHTDNVGDEEANLKLSQERAQAVFEALTARGVDGGGLTVVGFGSTRPLASNDTEEGRAENRRIDFRFAE
ncbi:OmpA family protein [Rhodobacteraceae bacterium NNCM2]|nr:OmpA family protein [Coraliihabitans acroporae]